MFMIRPFKPGDIDGIASLRNQLVKPDPTSDAGQAIPDEALCHDPLHEQWVLLDNGRIVGYLELRGDEIVSLSARSGDAEEDIRTRLMCHAKMIHKRLTANVAPRQEKAYLKLYRQHGFRFVREQYDVTDDIAIREWILEWKVEDAPMEEQCEVRIRPETAADAEGIRDVNDAAFGQAGEGRLVERLRANGAATISLVAEYNGRIVGHILFSPVMIEADGRAAQGLGLGPMAVMPECQGRGIGACLVLEGLERAEADGTPFCVVLGHPHFYPRFGFVPALQHGVRCKWDVADEAFMIRISDPAAMSIICGMAHYRPEFDDLT
jgi:putative acetyltransferase